MIWLLVARVMAVFLAHSAPFPFVLESFAPSLSLWRVPQSNQPPTIDLTFDDGPNPTATPALLDVLREGGARAMFFVIDAHVIVTTAPIVRRISPNATASAGIRTRAPSWSAHRRRWALLTRYADRIEQRAGASLPPFPTASRVAQRLDVRRLKVIDSG